MKRHIDAKLLLFVIFLITFGLVMVLSSSAIGEVSGTQFKYFYRQLIAVFLGGILCAGAALTPTDTLRKNHLLFYVVVAFGLSLCFVPGLGSTVKGASRWFGFGPFNVQPSAFAKIAALISLCHFLHRWRGQIDQLKVVLRAIMIPLPLMFLILIEPDFGTTLVMTGLIGVTLITAGMHLRHLIGFALSAFIIGVPVLFLESYRIRRMASWLDPWAAYDGVGYQIIQGWIALHTGGVTGTGLGNSISKRQFLPEPWTDFIAAVIGEELGFLGLLVIMSLYIGFLWRGLKIAQTARSAFGMYLATGLTVMIVSEAMFNLGVVMGLLPPKGLVLPFISYGASAMMSNLLAVGLLLSISAECNDVPVEKGWITTRQRTRIKSKNRLLEMDMEDIPDSDPLETDEMEGQHVSK